MALEKPFAPACERNRDPILEVLRSAFDGCRRVLEIGSGTGQHAVHFARAMPQLQWQCSEQEHRLAGLQLWLDEAALANTPPPLALDVSSDRWPVVGFDAAFSANTLHIMSWAGVEALFAGLDGVLEPAATVVIYGPFTRSGSYHSPSDAQFDAQLRSESATMGLRDVEAVDALAAGIGLRLVEAIPMPANNLSLHWRRGLSLPHYL